MESSLEGKTLYSVPYSQLPEEIQAQIDGKEQGAIKFTAAVWKVSTLADGGIRLVLDLEEGARDIMGELARCQQNGIVLKIEAKKS